jgi:hypothetical protein
MTESAPEQPVPDEAAEYTETHDAAAPTPDPVVDAPEPVHTPAEGRVTYKVTGRQALDEVKPGGLIDLDPNEPRTARLLARGQIAATSGNTEED